MIYVPHQIIALCEIDLSPGKTISPCKLPPGSIKKSTLSLAPELDYLLLALLDLKNSE